MQRFVQVAVVLALVAPDLASDIDAGQFGGMVSDRLGGQHSDTLGKRVREILGAILPEDSSELATLDEMGSDLDQAFEENSKAVKGASDTTDIVEKSSKASVGHKVEDAVEAVLGGDFDGFEDQFGTARRLASEALLSTETATKKKDSALDKLNEIIAKNARVNTSGASEILVLYSLEHWVRGVTVLYRVREYINGPECGEVIAKNHEHAKAVKQEFDNRTDFDDDMCKAVLNETKDIKNVSEEGLHVILDQAVNHTHIQEPPRDLLDGEETHPVSAVALSGMAALFSVAGACVVVGLRAMRARTADVNVEADPEFQPALLHARTI